MWIDIDRHENCNSKDFSLLSEQKINQGGNQHSGGWGGRWDGRGWWKYWNIKLILA